MSQTDKLNAFADALIDDAQLCEQSLYLALGQFTLRLRSNSGELIERLTRYFAHIISPVVDTQMEVIAIERDSPQLGIEFTDWKREPGKSGRKDSYYDFPHGRLLYKVRSTMVFLQSESWRIAAGPCLRNDNQVINFINSQYMNWLQQRGWLISHASGLVHQGLALGMAGFSGGGKSTLMLHMLENPAINFLSNDRLFMRLEDGTIQATGIPKQPRINPGTIVHNPTLHRLIPRHERATLLAMPREELWELEQKYDAMIEELYGQDRISIQAPLAAFLVLNWQRDSESPLQLQPVDIAQRRDLLAAIIKSPGPFYQMNDGSFYQDSIHPDEQAYIDILQNCAVYEASGGVDFKALAQRCLDELY